MPRCVFVMQSASDDVAEDRIVWTCCKNNDGELGDRSAWIRCNRRIEEAEKLKLIKFYKGKDAYELY
jgi:hypothetical protein